MAHAYKDVLIQLDNHGNYDSRLQAGLSLAQQDGAKLTALYGFELPRGPKAADRRRRVRTGVRSRGL
jgi:hypothetical protein